MNDLITAAQQALEALEFKIAIERKEKAITALRTALAQQAEPVQDLIPPESLFVCDQMEAHVTRVRLAQQAEPVAWRYKYSDGFWRFSNGKRVNGCDPIESQALYTAPPQRKPLTEEEIRDLWSWSMTAEAERTATTQQHAFTRAVERAHGIGGQDDNANS